MITQTMRTGDVVAIVQARMGSQRLPGKSLADVCGVPLIERVLRQTAAARLVSRVVLATTSDPVDDPLAARMIARGFTVHRGHPTDVLARYHDVAAAEAAEYVVRVTGDCPLHSPDTIDEVVASFLRSDADYASNIEPYTRPDGQDVEVFTRQVLCQAHKTATEGLDREHVTAWMRRHAGLKKLNVQHDAGCDAGSCHWSVDHPDDLEFVRRVWAVLTTSGDVTAAAAFPYAAIEAAVKSAGPDTRTTIINEGHYRGIYAAAPSSPAAPLTLDESERWLARSRAVIPGGAQTYSKSWRQHIRGVSPVFLRHGAGARVWDVDGNEYVDLIQGLLPNILGYAHPEVDRAAHEQTRRGHSFSLPTPVEVELAERLVRIIPCAEMVRFGKNGSDATAGAVRVARAFTRRDRVAVCGYHGWQDWFIGTTSRDAGVPAAVKQLAHVFPYNDVEALDRLLGAHPGEFAAVVMEPVNFTWPAAGYLAAVKACAHRHGALLVFDEICSGFHFGLGGAQQLFGVTPDLATFGKAMGNGYPISCIVGRRDVMTTFEDAFVSFTFAGDNAAMAAALAVLDILEHTDAYARMTAAGRRLRDGALAMAECAGLKDRFTVAGHPHWSLLRFTTAAGADDPVLKAFFVQEITRRGVLLLATHNISAALTTADTDVVLDAYAAALKRIATLHAAGTSLADELAGPVPTPAFRARS